jgi:hypothetical protein
MEIKDNDLHMTDKITQMFTLKLKRTREREAYGPENVKFAADCMVP